MYIGQKIYFRAGHEINFDLVYPSPSIPSDFFPSNSTEYGYTDFGVWNISYTVLSCSSWAGGADASALGSDPSIGSGGCCPANTDVRMNSGASVNEGPNQAYEGQHERHMSFFLG